ncbi:hypothetical protein SAMN05443247_06635 [Bradyrhizobium erythrophlei]|nr:hypothetical protein SAMN05443247_06635 [Bradyrhizobium erythrophlei]
MAAAHSKARRADQEQRPPMVEAAAVLSIIDVCQDPDLFGPWFKGQSWAAWFVFLRVMFGLPLDEAGLQLFQACTGRSAPSPSGYLEASLIIGRRGGKSLILALIATYLACFFDWRPFLTGGERGTIMVIAADRRQATVIFRYLREMLGIPLLAGMIQRETADTLELNNGVTIEIQTASFRTIRGRTVVAALADELAFWMSDDSANPDVEILGAIKPAMATIPKALMLKASSPYARRGALWADYRKHYAKDESTTLVWVASTRRMNPCVPQSFIDAAYEDDPASAAAEYDAQFRTDVEGYVTREAIEAVTSVGVFERPFITGQKYFAFCDPSGGAADSMTLAIGHLERGKIESDKTAAVDAIRERRAPFSPENVVDEFVQLLQIYKITAVTGDRYGSNWVSERFRIHGVRYEPAEKPKSDLYKDVLPAINSGQVDFLDHPRMTAQFCSLERRTARGGRDSIDHPPHGRDDIANAVAGLCCLIRADSNATKTRFIHLDYMGR